MSDTSNAAPTYLYHCNRYHAQAACAHCEGVVRHKPWCITANRQVYYAYEIVADSRKLAVGDSLILHSLGVVWKENRCAGICGAQPDRIS